MKKSQILEIKLFILIDLMAVTRYQISIQIPTQRTIIYIVKTNNMKYKCDLFKINMFKVNTNNKIKIMNQSQ